MYDIPWNGIDGRQLSGISWQQLDQLLVCKAPAPVFSWFKRGNDGVTGCMEVESRVAAG